MFTSFQVPFFAHLFPFTVNTFKSIVLFFSRLLNSISYRIHSITGTDEVVFFRPKKIHSHRVYSYSFCLR